MLDVGTGNGAVFAQVAPRFASGPWIASDLSLGMLQAARRRAEEGHLSSPSSPSASISAWVAFINADVQALPFPDGCFAVVMASHMLYHVPNIPLAVAELRRVLRPDGLLVAATGSSHDYAELFALHAAGARELGLEFAKADGESGVMGRFSLENGREYLAPHFVEVEVRTRSDALVFPTVDALMRYYLSGPIYVGASGPDDPRVPPGGWEALSGWVAERTREEIERNGVFRTAKISGAFLARK